MKAWLAWPCFAFVIGLVLAGCGSKNSSTATIAISPTSATVLLGTSLQFLSDETGSTNAIVWSVNGVANGNATFGTISSTGLYTAPVTRPVPASAINVPIVFAMANASIPNSGSTGSVIELQRGFDFTNFAPGNTINISGNSVAGWNGSFIILFSGQLANGNFGVQIGTPAGPPANGVGGTATATPNITITAQVQSTSAVASATISLDSGIRVSLSQPTCTIGTNETFPFTAVATGTSDQTFTWTLTGVGSIDSTTGLYTAPSTAGTATVTATSNADKTESTSATITIVTAADPTLASVSPPTGALGAAFQQVYLSGTNFICTTGVFINSIPVPTTSISSLSSATLLVSVPDSILSTQPTSPATTVTLGFTVGRQGVIPPPCSSSPCQLTLSPVRPAVVSSTPDSIRLPTAAFDVTLDGGYFGTTNTTAGVPGTPDVNVQFNGQTNPTVTFKSDRQVVLNVPSSDASVPGLYPISVANKVSGSSNGSMAVVNLAVEPTSAPTQTGSRIAVGAKPSSVAIDTATGFAVVANQGSSDITLINLATQTAGLPVCTDGGSEPCTARTATGPVSVAVDNIRNLALVANSANATLAVVSLAATPPAVTALLTFPSADPNGNTPFPLAPQAVAINPVSGRALVAFTTSSGTGGSNAGAILDLTQSPPTVINVVNLNNGVNPHIAVSPRLNWAIATPGGAGSLSIVDLGRQTTNQISTLSCSGGVVTVSTTTTVGLLAGQPVLISGATPSSLNGIFSVTNVSNNTFTFALAPCASGTGGTATYALPVATLATNLNVRGVSINDETQKALLVDPTNLVPAFVFNILDQTSSLVSNLPSNTNNVAAAMDPLTNVGLVLNQDGEVSVVDPVTPTVLSNFNTWSPGIVPPAVDVAIDPATNVAVVVSQGDNSVRLLSLGAMTSSPQIIQSSFTPGPAAQNSSHVTLNSTLSSPAVAQNETVTLIGNFPGTPVPRLDGDCSSAFIGSPTISNGRVMTATISGTFLTGATNGPRFYALDVVNSCATPTSFSNAAALQVVQAVSLATSGCSNPAPQGVAIDAVHNVALVTEPGCNQVSMVSLSASTTFAVGTGFGAKPELAVGTSPQGVGIYPQAGLAVAANAGSNNVSIVDIVNDDVPTTFTTDPIPAGVAVDLGTGKAVVTATGASLVDVFPVATTSQTPSTIGVQRGPTGVAIDPPNHLAVVANSSSNNASVVNLNSSTTTNTSGGISFPQGVAFDPLSANFLVTSSASNQVIILNPSTVASSAIRVGIDPSSIAYNVESGTLVTANNLSGTMTVVDFIDQTVRGVFSLQSSTQFAVDIHPQTNLAVVADTVGNRLLLVPLPH